MKPISIFPVGPAPLALLVAALCFSASAELTPPPGSSESDAAVLSPAARTCVKGLDLSRTPTTRELVASGQLGGPLFPTHELRDSRRAAEARRAFGRAIEQWNRHEYAAAVAVFRRYLEQYPDSPWAAEAELHIGCDATYNGRYSEAEALFTKIIHDHRHAVHTGARMLVNKARQRLALQHLEHNELESAIAEFQTLQRESPDWRHRTYASHWIQQISRFASARQALANCGAEALSYLLEKEGRPAAALIRTNLPASPRGHSLAALANLSRQRGLEMTALEVAANDLEQLPLPAVLRVGRGAPDQAGHYWILDKVQGDTLELYDPQAQRRFVQTRTELAQEWSGRVLVFSGRKQLPGRRLTVQEMEASVGGCCGVPRKEDDLGDPEEDTPDDPEDDPEDDPCSSEVDLAGRGAPRWEVNVINLNLFATDTPLWYDPPIGPPVKITLSYNSQSAIALNEPFGNKWQFNYASYLVVDTAGTVVIYMPDGRRDLFVPNGVGGYTQPFQVINRLTRIAPNHFELRFPDDTVYVYQIPSETSSQQPFLTEIRDATGQKLSFGFNSDVLLATITDAQGAVTTLEYNEDGLVTRVTDPFGRFAGFEYDENRNLTRITDMGGYASSLTYDANVYLKSLGNARGTSTFRIEPADGINNSSDAYPPPGSAMWANYRITVTDPLGNPSEYYYNGYSSYSWHVSPRHYRPWRSPFENNFKSDAPKTLYYFDQVNSGRQGVVRRIVSPTGGERSYEYDLDTGAISSVTDAHGHTWEFTQNWLGQITSMIDPMENRTSFTYAANGLDLIRVTDPLGEIALSWNEQHRLLSLTDRLRRTTRYQYNSLGQLIESTDARQITNTYSYNAENRLASVQRAGQTIESFTYDSIGRVRTHTDATGLTTTNEYNGLDQVTRVSYPDGRFESFAYAGCCPRLLDSLTDRAGRTTYLAHDALKRLVQRVDPEGGVTRYQYDPSGNLVQLTDPNGNVTRFVYDDANRLITKEYADGKKIHWAYDGTGLLVARTNARGIAISYEYNDNHDRTRIAYSDGTPAVTNTIDKGGRITRVQDGLGERTYTYDANSRVLSVNGPLADSKIAYGHDELGRATNVTVQLGQTVGYRYDDLNRLTEVRTPAGAYVYTYAGASPLEQRLSRPNASYTLYSYDLLNRLTLISNRKSTGAVINEFGYRYSALDMVEAETVTPEAAVGVSKNEGFNYQYNNLNQPVSVQPANQTLAYDADGNLTRGYTPDGFVFSAVYDAEDRLVKVQYTNASGVECRLECGYHADGQLGRLRRYLNNALTEDSRLVVDQFHSLQDRDGRFNTVSREYAWGLGLGGGIGGLLDLKAGAASYSYLYDGRGNVRAAIGADQASAAGYAYEPFGEPRSVTGSLGQPMRFSTKRYDEATGLSYFGYRFYSPGLGIWLTRDPIPNLDNLALYRFASDNPIHNLDALGLKPDPFKQLKKGDDYCKALDISKDTKPEVEKQGNILERIWKAVSDALSGKEGGTPPPPPDGPRGRRTLSDFPNQNP